MFERFGGPIGTSLFLFVFVCNSVWPGPDALAAPGDKLVREAGRSSETRQKLMAAGVLDATSDIVPASHVKAAVQLFINVYFDAPPDDTAIAKRLDEINETFVQTVDLRTSDYKNKIEIKIPARLLTDLRDLTPGVETLHVSGDGDEALRYGTYRYPLLAHTPQSLLREIFYSNRNLVVESMQSDESQFIISGLVRRVAGTIDHHFLRKAFQVSGATTALYVRYDHRAPEDFGSPPFYEPFLKFLVPPREHLELEEPDERHEKLVAWADTVYARVLKYRQPPESVTAIRRFAGQDDERARQWREAELDDYKREMFEIAVLEDLEDRIEGWKRWRRDTAWRLLVRSAVNIASSQFDTKNGWKNIEVTNCFAARPKNDGDKFEQVRIVFATNRARDLILDEKKPNGTRFNVKRLFKNQTDDKDKLHYGCAYITVPTDWNAQKRRETHVYEDWGWREVVRETDLNSYYSIRRYGYLGNSEDNARGERVRFIDRERWLAEREHMALIYVHGYNTAFHESLLRIAQIAAASQYPGRIYLFSWPSARTVSSYVADMDASEKSDPYLAEFVQSILLDSKITQLDVLAHSMGGQMFLRAFSRFRSSFDQVKKVRFGKVIFAAPDVSQSVFNEKINDIRPYTRGADGVSVYASSLDRVLLFSSFLRGGRPRAGDLSRESDLDKNVVNIIDATRPAWWCDPTQYSVLGHTYFSNSDNVLKDIIGRLTPRWRLEGRERYRYKKKQTCWYSGDQNESVASTTQ
ncbi:MAG: alpha/beta hydrolase [Hyphomicrobiaceae bacterium]